MPDQNPAPQETPESHSERPAVVPPTKSNLMIVGIGASAGGLSALQKFFDHVPADSNMAFVVVVHLAPDYKSHLPDLLRAHVQVPIEQVKETTELKPNHVYVIPPNANLSAIDTHLRLSELEESRVKRAPIDHFFRTLASTHDGNAVGVILTGTGSDGTLGIQDIKAKGGVVIIQDPVEAEYDGMPLSALATGMADLVLPVAEIADAILRFHRTAPKVPVAPDGEEIELNERALLQRIFTLIRTRTDRDFTRYKRSTVVRRISRRMQLSHLEDLPSYLQRLREQPEEVRALADDLLITVTSFFRDPEVFRKLEKEVIPKLFDGKGQKDTVRAWSVGCATGEEAYSIAMLLLEEAGKRDGAPHIQIFASDLHRKALERAREGFYPGDMETDVSPERLKRFFQKENGGYRIRKEVRDLVIFAPHNLLADPPFSRLDLISCRNLLMYLERDVQRAVIELFHYALNPDGILLLGPAETIDNVDLFRAGDKKTCFYRKRNVPPPELRLPVFPLIWSRQSSELGRPSQQIIEPIPFGALHQRMVETYAPPSLLVSPDNKLVHLSENAGRYLVHPGGEPTANLFKLVREELRIELQALLQTAREKRQAVDSKPIPVRFNGSVSPVVMHIGPAREPDQEGFALIIFEEREPTKEGEPAPGPKAGQTKAIHDLEHELEVARQRLRDVIEEYEKSQEEMKASNEEMQSTNEELRSTMEELETSKEELQSINEELQTVNQENRHKVEELDLLSSDLQNLLSATQIATLFLDMDLRIMRFTPTLSDLFNVRTTDRGRPISDLTHRLGYPELQSDAQSVRDRLQPIEREVNDERGQWYFTRILPYRSTSDHIEGVVITFMDITRRVEAEQALRGSEHDLARGMDARQRVQDLVSHLGASHDLSGTLGPIVDLTIDITGAQMGNIQLLDARSNSLEIVVSRGYKPELLEHFRSVSRDPDSVCGQALTTGQRVVIADVEKNAAYTPHRQIAAAAGYRSVQSTPLLSRDGHVVGMLSTHYREPQDLSPRDLRVLDLCAKHASDFIERYLSDEALRSSEERYRLLIESAQEYAIFMLDPDGKVATWNAGAERIFGFTEKEIVGSPAAVLFTKEDREADAGKVELTRARAGRASDERWYLRKDGTRVWASGTIEPLHARDGVLRGFVKVLRDNSERTTAEEIPVDSQLLIAAARAGRLEEAETAVRFILEGNEKMREMLSDLLTYTRFAVGDEGPDQQVDLNGVLAKVLENLRKEIDESQAKIAFDTLPVVRGREHHFIRLFQNLIDNAIRYRGDRAPDVRISAERAGSEWRLSVADNGIGIEPRYHKQIFEVFTRLPGQKGDRTGIGLAICRRVVERFGGSIRVESRRGEGAKFVFTLPADEKAESQQA